MIDDNLKNPRTKQATEIKKLPNKLVFQEYR